MKYKISVFLFLLFFGSLAVAVTSFSAQQTGDQQITATWQIADQEYIITNNIGFNLGSDLNSKFTTNCDIGEDFQHSFFGKIKIAKQKLTCVLQLNQAVANNLKISATVQTCVIPETCQAAITYQTQINRQDVASNNITSNKAKKSSLFNNLFSSNTTLGNEPLPVDEAFVFTPTLVESDGIHVRLEIADEHYLYQDKFKFEFINNKFITLANAKYPKAKVKDDLNFGRMEVFYHNLDIVVPVNNTSNLAQNINLTVTYQGCAEKGICYPPTKKTVALVIPAMMTAVNINNGDANPDADFNLNNQQQSIEQALNSGSIWLIISLFFGAGLLLAFTACLFPMIPILSSIITDQKSITTLKSLGLSLAYVLPMALVYSSIGVASGLLGESVAAWFQKPWVLMSFGVIIIAMALSMFGLYNIQMPSFIQNKATNASNRQKGGTFIGAAVMGILSTLIVGACSAPVLSVAIGFIAKTGDPVLGGLALLAMSLGIGTPLIVIGTSAGKLLPQPGVWMDRVKYFFGVIMLAVALYIIDPVLPATVMMALWGGLLIGAGVYLGAFNGGKLSGWQQLAKSFGLIIMVYGTLLIIGMATGKGSLLTPLKGFAAAGSSITTPHTGIEFKRIKTVADLKQELASAQQNQQFVMLDFYADWCKSCLELEEFTFNDNSVRQALAGAKLLQADVTLNDQQDIELLKYLRIIGPPAILFFNKSTQENRNYRLNGFFAADDFTKHVKWAFK